MKITKRGEYALRALLAMASIHDKRTLSLRQIAVREKLPLKFLEQIMMTLKKSGFVESVKGKHGGYTLSCPPHEITLGEIIRAIDGPLSPIATGDEIRKRIQREERHPGLYFAFLEVRDAISAILDKKTLADVCEKSTELARSKIASGMYDI